MLIKWVSPSAKMTKVFELANKLQELRALGKTDSELEDIIKKLDLPFDVHMFVMGNFSLLMENKIRIRMA